MTSKRLPPLFGLVLSGGNSSRMGMDKSQLDYHGRPQEEWVRQLLSQVGERVFVSKRHSDFIEPSGIIIDHGDIAGHGPISGVLSAMRTYPEVAWLVIGCDYPFIEAQTLRQLIEHRSPELDAVAFRHPSTGISEPLLSILEPHCLPVLEKHVRQEGHSLRMFLENTKIGILTPENPDWLRSVDIPEDAVKAKIYFSKSDGS